MLRVLTGLILAAVTASAAFAVEDWSKFNACLVQNQDAVERVEPSLFDGAKLIVDVICNSEAAELGNQMVREPERQGLIKDLGFSAAFGEFLGVMRREATAVLFKTRKLRLGL